MQGGGPHVVAIGAGRWLPHHSCEHLTSCGRATTLPAPTATTSGPPPCMAWCRPPLVQEQETAPAKTSCYCNITAYMFELRIPNPSDSRVRTLIQSTSVPESTDPYTRGRQGASKRGCWRARGWRAATTHSAPAKKGRQKCACTNRRRVLYGV